MEEIVGTSNKLFQNLKFKEKISDNELNYFTYENKEVTNLDKICLRPKIYKRLTNVPGRPLTMNCVAPAEKADEFLDHHLKSVMQKRTSYIKGSKDFVNKVKHLQNTPESAILVTADVVVLYASIPYEVVLNALRVALDNREHKSIDTESLIKIAEIILKNNFFEFNVKYSYLP